MTEYVILPSAADRLEDIYVYSHETWGTRRADLYLDGLYEMFRLIAAREINWKDIPPDYDTRGWYCAYRSHIIYWSLLSNGKVGIRSVLHDRMNLARRLRDDFALTVEDRDP